MKKIFRKLISKFSKYSLIYENAFDLQKILNFHEIDIIFDVGASWGGYAKSLRRFGFKDKIISFEPVNASYEKLLKNSFKDSSWHVHKKIIITNKNIKKQMINVSKDFDNSSLLNLTKLHSENHVEAKYSHQEEVECDSLDNLVSNYLKDEKNLMLKVDVQGTEMDVLKSAINNIKKFKLVQIELSLHKMYEKQVLWKEIIAFMNDCNFDIWTIYPGYKKKSIGQLYQFDVIFYNKQL
jgi:FkbM family methyltransferase